MKAYNKPATSKLVARFDKELRDILMNDLKVVKAKNNLFNTMQSAQLSAA